MAGRRLKKETSIIKRKKKLKTSVFFPLKKEKGNPIPTNKVIKLKTGKINCLKGKVEKNSK